MTLARLSAAEAARADGLLRFDDYRGMGAAVTETADEALAGLDQRRATQLPNLITGLVRDVAADPVTGAPTPVSARSTAQRLNQAAPIGARWSKRSSPSAF